ncbi:MAG TPA: hypothetical protein EYQ53_03355 [Candidatus Poseidoniales archaeon]|jgi:hypothetical protein|nr:MAG: hypothetical protein CXT68_07240 [Euryarchaeota archaeon]HIG03404.1 hypothetical protein [Candidatus Poseidoniales archaeon]
MENITKPHKIYMMDYLVCVMTNRLTVLLVASLFMLISSSVLAEEGSESSETLPDLMVTGISDENSTHKFTHYNITNIGGALSEDILENVSLHVWIDEDTSYRTSYVRVLQIADGDGLSEFQFQSLLDEGHGRTPDWGIGRGNHTIRACIDSSNIVSEANEDNNCWEGVVTRRESTPGPLPDLKIEPAWDEDIPWSKYLGTGNRPSFNIVNIGGELPEDCRLNCTYFTWADEGTNISKKMTYSFSTIDEIRISDLIAGNTTQWGVGWGSGGLYGEHTLRACIDAMDYVDESNEDNNCWEGNLTILPDLRWYQGNPDGTFSGRGSSTSDAPEGDNDVYLQTHEDETGRAYGRLTIKTGYTGTNPNYGGNPINMSVTLDERPLDWIMSNSWGMNYTDGEKPDYYRIYDSGVVRVCFDPDNLINETNEDNNCIEKTLVNPITDSDREMTDERSALPALSVSLTLGILALATITSRTQRKTKK